ncbi:uncharacterized protein LOC119742753 [Patiria miniata]|uniref:Centromere/kinetochore protein zw10 N-terminal domain-containing protein n=1 Tax=Patiria miniata TaxID=46514 RepID=A0A914BG16_PATMI|nr:uncharacterized protein LOC119742753 [Patiria miniata]
MDEKQGPTSDDVPTGEVTSTTVTEGDVVKMPTDVAITMDAIPNEDEEDKSKDLLEKEDLGTRIGKLSTHIDEIKGEIYHAVHKKYANYRPTRDSTQELHNKVQTLSTEMQTLSNKIKVCHSLKALVTHSRLDLRISTVYQESIDHNEPSRLVEKLTF